GADRAWLLCRGAVGLDRRRPAAVGGLGTAPARPPGPHRLEPGPCGSTGWEPGRGVAGVAAWLRGNGSAVASSAGSVPLGEAGSAGAEEPASAAGGGAAATGGATGSHAAGGGQGAGGGGGAVAAVREGDQELLARVVLVL